MSANKKRKEIDGHIRKLKDEHRHLDKDIVYYRDYIKLLAKKDDVQVNIDNNDAYVQASINALKDVLREFELYEEDTVSEKGKLVSGIAEINPVLFSLIYEHIRGYSPLELVTFFSVFCDIKVSENDREYYTNYTFLEQAVATLQNAETMHKIHVKDNGLGPFCYDLLDTLPQWCECTDEAQCKQVFLFLRVSSLRSLNQPMVRRCRLNALTTACAAMFSWMVPRIEASLCFCS